MTAGVVLRGRRASGPCMLRHGLEKAGNMAEVMKAMRASAQAILFSVAATGAPSALAQDDAAKRKNQYGLDAAGSTEYGRGQSQGQGLRRPGGVTDDKKEKRGNTPPGSDRAGDVPASGAIVDPAGVTRK